MRKKLFYLKYILFDKLPYPLHLNLLSAFAFLFGSLRLKILYDIFRRPDYAYGIYEAAIRAKGLGYKGITVIEFGVANGRGLMAMIGYSKKIAKKLDIEINILGFDSGQGMPDFVDFRDHPELYTKGDFPMGHREKLMSFMPPNSKLVLLDLIKDPWITYDFLFPIGFISIDVDYYSSTISILNQLHEINNKLLLPNTLMYFDDVLLDNHNRFQGESLAIKEFNERNSLRKIDSYSQNLRHKRVYKYAPWIDKMYQLHVLDHFYRQNPYRKEDSPVTIIKNKYFDQ